MKTAAFTGHRTIYPHTEREIFDQLTATIERLHADGYRTFISGMAMGFDLLAAEAVLMYKTQHADMQLITAVPFIGQEDRFSEVDKQRYADILTRCDEKIVIADSYHTGVYHQRNDYMVDRCSVLIAYFDGKPSSGTGYTVARAAQRSIPVVNLY